jgi:sugar phosphate isomerase/epimerase
LKADLHLAAGDGKMDFLLFKELMEKNHVDVRVLLEVNGIDKAKRSLEYMASL